jgi:hypothetical protein
MGDLLTRACSDTLAGARILRASGQGLRRDTLDGRIMPAEAKLSLLLYGFVPGDERGSFKTERIIPNAIEIGIDFGQPLGAQLEGYIGFIVAQAGHGTIKAADLGASGVIFAVSDSLKQLDLTRTPSELGLSRDARIHALLNERHFPPHIALGLMSKAVNRRVFIGHGRSNAWKDLRDFISQDLKLDWDEFNRLPIPGISTLARLNEMLSSSCFALLILTAEDEQADGSVHARENVIHEAGLFQGRLGFEKAILLVEDGCSLFSNIDGLGQIRFPKGDIYARFHEIRRVLERERMI